MSDKENFTQGEWSVSENSHSELYEINFDGDGECIAELIHEKEDAYLMACAPEMYEMLKMLLEGCSINDSRIDKEVEKLLAKSRGEL